MKIKLLIGGSPCTYWSIAQKNNRETEASGLGWELFCNYVIARDKFKPDYFLYENNKSMSKQIRASITEAFGFEPICINSALVSAQNRQRLYWVGKRNEDGTYSKVDVEQPQDKGILLKDILESGQSWINKSHCIDANYWKGGNLSSPKKQSGQRNMVAEPVRIGSMPRPNGELSTSQGMRIYSIDGKSITISTNGGGLGSKTGLYAIPVEFENNISVKAISCADGKTYTVYEVKDGQIAIKGKQYPIKLTDGFYIIRKLTVRECMRLQTVPKWYEFPVSNTQAYKMLGNGWTVDVIAHILSNCNLKERELDVLSMYDGMACGYIALKNLGAKVRNYYATEIDNYAIKTATHNFPDIIELGDAFSVRNDNWNVMKEVDFYESA